MLSTADALALARAHTQEGERCPGANPVADTQLRLARMVAVATLYAEARRREEGNLHRT